MGRIIVGQEGVIEQLLIAVSGPRALPAGGRAGAGQDADGHHAGPAMRLAFRRIQFTPDLMPADITGTDILQEDQATGHRQLVFERGPIFAKMILADEINRTPPKTQAALLEAMQEHRSRSAARPTSSKSRSSCWPRRTPSNRKAPIPCPRPSATGSCSTSSSIIPTGTRSGRSSTARPAASRPRWSP